jgi:hypothetical protein
MINYNLTVRTLPETERSIVAANVLTTFVALGTPLLYPSRILYLYNGTNEDINLSWDGINKGQTIPAAANEYLNLKTNDGYFGQGTQFYVTQTGTAPTTGTFYLTSFYGAS